VLFVYRTCVQESAHESPIYLLYGRDPRLPTERVLCPAKVRTEIDLKEYGQDLTLKTSQAWELARQSVKKAQKYEKTV